jgi:hypothetical protein
VPYEKDRTMIEPAPPAREHEKRLLIGWKEYVHFPEWKLPRLKVKIDTGARTSVLDVLSYELIHDAEQHLIAELRLPPLRRKTAAEQILRVPVQRIIVVRNSGGIRERRPLMETTIRIGPVTKRIRLTVANRSGMLFRMILGRSALKDDFIVDVSRKYLMGRN